MSLLDGEAPPQTTGSIAPAVSVQRPLPSTLAYSDAARIGQAATAVLAQAEGGSTEEWVNVSTGSSGTVQTETSVGADNCRQFSTIVTSVGGVHSYSGAICQQANGPSVVQIDERSKDDRS
jgi:surface antigen